MTTPLHQLIHLPERVNKADFVVRLTDGLVDGEQVLADYVVTPQLAARFGEALDLIRTALDRRSSKASFLHGSFGAGKSHFMAVLGHMLAGTSAAKDKEGLIPLFQKHQAWLGQVKLLMVGIHMLDESDLGSAILRRCTEALQRLHPDSDPPAVHRADGMLADADRLRQQMGDFAFLNALNARPRAKAGGGGWGALQQDWTLDSYHAARAAPAGDADRLRLVGDVTATLLQSYSSVVTGISEAYLPLDDGLKILAGTAQSLGYGGIVLFLDEAVLWLASRSADRDFVVREANKLVKLVEANEQRPIPIISFIARQRDLHELIGDALPGIEQMRFADLLGHNEQRFGVITLEDRDLPQIASRRLLRPVSPIARDQVHQQVDRLLNRQDLREGLIGTTATPETFRLCYPFSPALVEALIAVSSALQRERTALRLMAQMLAERRDTLKLGEVIPVGDLWDPLAEGAEPFSSAMRSLFEDCRKLWENRLRPLLDREHKVQLPEGTVEESARPAAWHNDARLLKTLLLAVLAPEVPALKDLTLKRLAALNLGSVQSVIPGREDSKVKLRLEALARDAGELSVNADTGVVTLRVSGVDTEQILSRAREVDQLGARMTRLRRLLAELLFPLPPTGRADKAVEEARSRLVQDNSEPARFAITWRGTRREVAVRMVNIRAADEALLRQTPEDGSWLILLDYPIDEQGHSPREDLALLQRLQIQDARTVAWLCSHFGQTWSRDLGTLVIIEHVLQDTRLEQFASHLSGEDRVQARLILQNRREAMLSRLRAALRVAYGLEPDTQGQLGAALEQDSLLNSLSGAVGLTRPAGQDLREAMGTLAETLMASDFPACPSFDYPLEKKSLERVLQTCLDALHWMAQGKAGGLPLQDNDTLRCMRGIAVPLRLGTCGQDRFMPGDSWVQHVQSRRPGSDQEPIGLKEFHALLDEPSPMGLPPYTANLIAMVFAHQTHRQFQRHGAEFQPNLEMSPEGVQMVPVVLPTPEIWQQARSRAALLGLDIAEARTPRQVKELTNKLKERLPNWERELAALQDGVQKLLAVLGMAEEAPPPRLATLRAAMAFVAGLQRAREPVGILGGPMEDSPEQMARVIAAAGRLHPLLGAEQIEWFGRIGSVHPSLADERDHVLQRAREVAAAEEHQRPLAPALSELVTLAKDLIDRTLKLVPPPPLPDPPGGHKGGGPTPPSPGDTTHKNSRGSWTGRELPRLQRALTEALSQASDTAELEVFWSVIDRQGAG